VSAALLTVLLPLWLLLAVEVLLLSLGSLATATPYLGAILLGVILMWLKAADSLRSAAALPSAFFSAGDDTRCHHPPSVTDQLIRKRPPPVAPSAIPPPHPLLCIPPLPPSSPCSGQFDEAMALDAQKLKAQADAKDQGIRCSAMNR